MSDTSTSAPSTDDDTAPRPAVGTGGDSAGRVSRLISAGAVMAAGTAVSRVMGFFRLMLLAFLFGNSTRQADMFNIANQLPNSMYILLAGGVLNTVLVPQLVRAIKTDQDRGEAYTNRIMTLGLLLLGVITIALTLAVPAIIHLYSDGGWREPALTTQYQSMVMLGYYCMPQVFFYGVHVLAGQVLNARDKFGPMMWAPIANNIVSIMVLTLFLIIFGHGNNATAFTAGEQQLLGLGATLGIAVQAAVLVPFLKSAGYRFRPRFDFRHTGLGKTFHLAKWTLGFVLVTQLALVVVTRLASKATVEGQGGGLSAYTYAYAVWILPHSLVTVSLATAMLPSASRLAAEGDRVGVAEETTRTIRLAVTALLPVAVAFVFLGLPAAQLIFGFGQGARDAAYVGSALMALAIGLVPFTVQYVCLRAFYALEDTRSTFFLQCLIAAANVVFGIAAVLLFDRPALVATGLGLAYSLAYGVGVVVSFRRLGRRLPELDGESLIKHCIRLIAAVAPAAAVAWVIVWLFTGWSSSRFVLALGLIVGGAVAVLLFLVAARMLKIREVTDIIKVIRRRGASGAPTEGAETAGAEAAGAGDSPIENLLDHEPANQLPDPGDSPTVIRSPRDTIGEAPTAVVAPQQPDGPTENADAMAQAAIARTYDDDEAAAGPASRAATLPAGTVLASRYRLEELLAESAPTVTWRAFDLVLSRSVLVHLLAPGAEDEADLLTAARKASVATDSRFLRVLDAVHSSDPELGSYIVCEYATGRSLEMILSHGPLSGLEAAWVVREVADALAGVHGLGLYHRRINPDTVIITPTGNVKIVGLLIEAALRPTRTGIVHGADTPELVDVTDLGRLLYATLVARWPGGPGFSLPDAPVVGQRWMTPRQVRAGVSPALDNVCDQILGDPPRHRAMPVTTAHGVVLALTKVLGSADAAGDLERRLKQPIPMVGARSDRADRSTPQPVSSLLEQPAPAQRPQVVAAAGGPPTAVRAPVPKPAGQAAKSGSGQTTVIRPVHRPAQRGPRRWIGILLILAVLLIAAGVVAAMVLDQRLASGPAAVPPAKPSASTSAAPPAKPVKLTIVNARDFDPQATPPEENPAEVPLAYDGNLKTRWRTVQYLGTPKLGNLKRGVGLVVDLGSAQAVREVKLNLSGKGTSVEFRVPKNNPSQTQNPPMKSDSQWRTVASESKAGGTVTLTAKQSVTTRYVLVYLTSLPKEGTGYRGGIYEVEVRQ